MGDVWTSPTIGSAMRAKEGVPIGTGEPGEPPGFLDSVGLGWQRARAAPDWGYNQRNYEERFAFDTYKVLQDKGYVTRPMDDSLVARIGRTLRGGQPDPFWAALAKARADGVKLPHPDIHDAASLTAYAQAQRRRDMARADARLADGSTAGMLTGELLAGMADPTSYLPVGGSAMKAAGLARSILSLGVREAKANAGMAVAMEPWVQRDAAALGVDRTAAEAGTDIAVQGGAGFVLGGLGGAASHLLRGRGGDDRLRADFETAVPAENRTEEEQAALGVLEGASEADRANPFVPSPRGDDVHAARWQNAGSVARGERSYVPEVKRASVAEVAAGAPANLRFGERARYKARVRAAESSGNDIAQAASSSAYGRYQPIKSTWLAWFNQRYPGNGLTPDQIYAKRADGALQEIFMDDFTAQNAAALRRAGFEETADNLYLAHFLGVSDAVRVLGADAGDAITRHVRPKSIAANRRILEGKSVGDVRAWAARKMGGEGGDPVRVAAGEPGEAAPMAPREALTDIWARMADDIPDGGWAGEPDMPLLRPELFPTPEAHARAQIAMEADIDAWEGFDIVDRWTAADEMARPVPVKGRGKAVRRGPMDLNQFLASKGGLRDDEGHDLKGMFDGNPLVPGAGALIRQDGMALDRAMEAAVEAGYFGNPERSDWTVAELIDALDRQNRSGQRHFAGSDLAEIEQRRQRIQSDEQYAEFADRTGAAAAARGLEWADDDTLRAYELWDGDFNSTIDRVIGEHLDQARMDDAVRADPALPTEMRRAAENGYSGGATLPEEEMMAWDDPYGPAAEAQMMSIEHDMRMLADAEPGIRFRLTEDGPEQALADILADIDEEDAVIKAIEACL